MIPLQTFETYAPFATGGTKSQPEPAKYAAGFQQSDVLPAEWMNWAWNKNTVGITDLNRGVTSIEKEVLSVLTEANMTAYEATTNQLVCGIVSIINKCNAGTACKLKTARKINGTNFDGTAAITTCCWGTARNISISDSDGANTGLAVSVNGSGAVTLKLPATIKASLSGTATCAVNATCAACASSASRAELANMSGYVLDNATNGTAIYPVAFLDGIVNSCGSVYTSSGFPFTFQPSTGTLTVNKVAGYATANRFYSNLDFTSGVDKYYLICFETSQQAEARIVVCNTVFDLSNITNNLWCLGYRSITGGKTNPYGIRGYAPVDNKCLWLKVNSWRYIKFDSSSVFSVVCNTTENPGCEWIAPAWQNSQADCATCASCNASGVAFGTAATSNTGTAAGCVPTIGTALAASRVVVTDANGNLTTPDCSFITRKDITPTSNAYYFALLTESNAVGTICNSVAYSNSGGYLYRLGGPLNILGESCCSICSSFSCFTGQLVMDRSSIHIISNRCTNTDIRFRILQSGELSYSGSSLSLYLCAENGRYVDSTFTPIGDYDDFEYRIIYTPTFSAQDGGYFYFDTCGYTCAQTSPWISGHDRFWVFNGSINGRVFRSDGFCSCVNNSYFPTFTDRNRSEVKHLLGLFYRGAAVSAYNPTIEIRMSNPI